MTGQVFMIDMQMLHTVAGYAGSITCILTLISLLIRPIRERIFGETAIQEGQSCLLRSEIVRIYYRHLDQQALRQYEYENLCYCYKAYRQLGGNSFVEHIYLEMQEWTVIQ